MDVLLQGHAGCGRRGEASLEGSGSRGLNRSLGRACRLWHVHPAFVAFVLLTLLLMLWPWGLGWGLISHGNSHRTHIVRLYGMPVPCGSADRARQRSNAQFGGYMHLQTYLSLGYLN